MSFKSLDAMFHMLQGKGIFDQGDDAVCSALQDAYGAECGARREDLCYCAVIPGFAFDVAGVESFIPQSKAAPVGGIGWLINNLAQWDLLPPPYVSLGEMGNLMKQVIFRKPVDPTPVLTDVLSKVFSTEQLARYQVEMYEKFDVFRGFEKTTDECIKAFELGMNSIAIVGLIPVLEGVLRNIGEREVEGFQGSTSKDDFLKLIDHLSTRLCQEAYSLYDVPAFMRHPDYIGAFHDKIQMLNAFREYFKTRLYESTGRVVGPIDLNRHSVLHGLVSDFDKPINFYRLIIGINFLGWTSYVLGHTESTIVLPATALSKERAKTYSKYKALGEALQLEC
jgi:hypothetical protein